MNKNRSYSLYLWGTLPFLLGYILNLMILYVPYLFGFLLIFLNILFLIFWGYLAYRIALPDRSPWLQALQFNTAGVICLILLMTQRYMLGQYLPNMIGFLPQIYFLPSLSAAVTLFHPVLSLITPVLDTVMGWPLSFLCMFVSSLIGFTKA